MNSIRCITVISTLLFSSYCLAAADTIDIKKYAVTPCDVVMSQNSTDWVKTYVKAYGDNTLEQVKAIYQYGVCYDQKLSALKQKLNAQNKSPLMGATGNFRDFEAARTAMVGRALAVCSIDGSYKRILRANADLYGKQFQYYFYQQYLAKPDLPKVDVAAQNKAKEKLNSIVSDMEKSGQDCRQIRLTLAAYIKEGIEVNQLPAQQIYEYPIMLLQSREEPPYSKPPF